MALAGVEKVPRQPFTNWQNITWNPWLPPQHARALDSTQELQSSPSLQEPKEQLLDPLNRTSSRPWLGCLDS